MSILWSQEKWADGVRALDFDEQDRLACMAIRAVHPELEDHAWIARNYPKRSRLIAISHEYRANEALIRKRAAAAERERISKVKRGLIKKSWRDIVGEVARRHKVKVEAMTGPCRVRSLVRAREEACYRLRTELGMTYPKIAVIMGGRDHTSILNSVRQYEKKRNAVSPAPVEVPFG